VNGIIAEAVLTPRGQRISNPNLGPVLKLPRLAQKSAENAFRQIANLG
jgi:hypothetical protein